MKGWSGLGRHFEGSDELRNGKGKVSRTRVLPEESGCNRETRSRRRAALVWINLWNKHGPNQGPKPRGMKMIFKVSQEGDTRETEVQGSTRVSPPIPPSLLPYMGNNYRGRGLGILGTSDEGRGARPGRVSGSMMDGRQRAAAAKISIS